MMVSKLDGLRLAASHGQVASSSSRNSRALVSSPGQLHRFTRAAGELVAAVEHVGDVVDLLRACGGVPGGGPQVDVPKLAETVCTGTPASRQWVAQ